jgi:hypothetical protein
VNELQITEFKNIRVLTTQQIAEAYGTDAQVITNNFNRNKDRYLEEKHFICLKGNELKEFRAKNQNDVLPNANKLYLWTEKGAFLHAKSLNTDEAWAVYENLVDTYFNRKKPLTALEQLQLTQQAVLEVKEQVDSVSKDLQDFKNDMPLLAVECEKITRAVKNKGVEVLGGRRSEAYRNNSLRSKVYRDIHSEVRRQFGVNTYKALKRNVCDKVIAWIEDYQLPLVLKEEVNDFNSQLRMEV